MGMLNLLRYRKVRNRWFVLPQALISLRTKIFPNNKMPLFLQLPYGISKMASELYLDFYQTHRLNYISLRYGNVCGPRQDLLGEAGVIAIFMAKMLKGEIPTIYGDGECIRDYVYVKDVARACLLSIKNMVE